MRQRALEVCFVRDSAKLRAARRLRAALQLLPRDILFGIAPVRPLLPRAAPRPEAPGPPRTVLRPRPRLPLMQLRLR
eukprot:15443925-Alexandrium_andersonii.AAC.1